MAKKGGNEAALARQDEQERQARIREGTTKINDTFNGQFTDDFFKNRAKAFVDYASPQLEDQYSKAQRELTFALTRSGLLDSSVRGEKAAELQKEYDTNRRSIADQGLAFSNEARNAVEGARGDLISMLNVTGDAQGAANSAISRASALSAPGTFSPIGQMFANFTNALGTQAALEKAAAYSGGAITPRYNTGLFGNPGAVKVS